MDKRISTVLSIVITAAWAVSFIFDMVAKTYDPPPSVHALMMMLAGAVLGGLLVKRSHGNDKEVTT